ncbi:hypothetical protein A2765_01235 [Candidatus Kaiserbacteria bacterium RIFCSPHIGHO2_01_FULL_56_24]|uniref:Uncharacterized protein n=1 Tax=Candidatus Kaiserbacteria bacterium RIFCSPHIGHO2_01_FULL_56_24 TaxID=1798487 RepID=A0A1F6DGI5_9BACT|nr:MAG: hypothetical protein A2765_01235 [Candidatus Kaiserbacteria bacterium RIFCSPHIGHO2_01_FULL_56_24]
MGPNDGIHIERKALLKLARAATAIPILWREQKFLTIIIIARFARINTIVSAVIKTAHRRTNIFREFSSLRLMKIHEPPAWVVPGSECPALPIASESREGERIPEE